MNPPPRAAAPRVWQFAASHTHLYPGARLRWLGAANGESPASNTQVTPQRGDTLRVEFADLSSVIGRVAAAATDHFDATMRSHTTARGALVDARRWRIAYDDASSGAAGGCKVARRLDGASTSRSKSPR